MDVLYQQNPAFIMMEMASLRMSRDKSGEEVNPTRVGHWVRSDAVLLKRCVLGPPAAAAESNAVAAALILNSAACK